MKKRLSLSTTLQYGLKLSAFGLIALAPFALAEPAPDYTFQPSAQWTTSAQSQNIADAAVHSCAVSTTFNNGFIMTFDGSHKWVQSLQIDLRQAALERGKSYDVSLSVPGQTNISSRGIADSNNVLNINLNGQKKLYQAIRDNAVLDVGIEGNDFRFYMVNFQPAAKDFERCMAGGDIQTAASGEQLIASASSDPFGKITTNEAIAFEEAETQKISAGDSAATAAISEAIPDASAKGITENAEPIIANARSVAENANELRPAQTGQRFTESLAAQIEDNPDLVALDPPADLKPEDLLTEDAETLHQETLPATEDLAITDMVETDQPEIAQAPTPQNTEQNTKNTPEPAKGKSLVIPSDIEEITLDETQDETKDETKPEPADIKTATIQPKTPSVPVASAETAGSNTTNSETLTADDLNRMQLARFNQPSSTAIIAAPATRIAQAPQPDAAAPVTDEEPFSQPLEKVTSRKSTEDIDISVQKTETAEAAEPTTPDTLAPVPEKDVAIVETKRYVTPEFPTTTQNQKLEANFTKAEPSSGHDTTGYNNDPDIGRKISQLEKMIQELQAENTALEDELQASLKDTKQERMAISSENWNLERATMRYDEAERQLKSIGQQLQRERTQCQLEKQELEAMLFDPQITGQEQLARLATLERKLMEAEAKLRQYEAGTH